MTRPLIPSYVPRIVCLVALAAGPVFPASVYVDSRADGANDGSSWNDAFTSLADALLVPGAEVWVAGGSYSPAPAGGDRNAAFRVASGQALYGGFRGDETARSQRDPAANPTVLTGDLDGDDLPGGENTAENSYHVLRLRDADATAVIDGFIVRGGSARESSGFNSAGGGVLLQDASPRIVGCRFEGNFARAGGAAVVIGGSPEFSGCAFIGNQVANGRGGAISIGAQGAPAIDRCVFRDNRVRGGVGANDGGAIFVDLGAAASVTRCIFEGNSSTSSSQSIVATGGAISSLGTGVLIVGSTFRRNEANVGGAVWTGKDISIINCSFGHNLAFTGDGGIDAGGIGGGLVAFGALVTLANPTFVGNEADDAGGIFSGTGSTISIVNGILWGNGDSSGMTAGAQLKGPGAKNVSSSCIQGGFSGAIADDPALVDPDGPDDQPGTPDDNFRLLAGSPCIDSGDNAGIPAGIVEDIDGGARRRDDPATADTGLGGAPIVDMGAHEFAGASATGTVVIEGGAVFSASSAVELTLTASGAGATRMRFSNDAIAWTEWEPMAGSRAWSLEAGEGTRTVLARFGDAAGSVLAEVFDSIILDTVPPSGSILIDGGATATTSPAVALTLSASDAGSGVAGMRLSDDGASWTAWEPFASTAPWTLPGGPGLKTVHVQYRDALGNVSPAFSDVIELLSEPTTPFLRGDANTDGILDISDPVTILLVLFSGHSTACRDALDVDDSGGVDITDPIVGLTYLFQGGAQPSSPFPACGPDPTGDGLGCDAYDGCP